MANPQKINQSMRLLYLSPGEMASLQKSHLINNFTYSTVGKNRAGLTAI